MRKNSLVVIVLVSCVLLLAGCSRYARGPKFQPIEAVADGKALVYVYRPLISQFKAADPNVLVLYIDDERIGAMKIGGYAWALLDPGQHTVRLRATLFFGSVPTHTEREATLTVEPGQEYYLCFERNIGGIDPVGIVLVAVAESVAPGSSSGVSPVTQSRRLSLVPKEVALQELQRTRLIGSIGKEAEVEAKQEEGK